MDFEVEGVRSRSRPKKTWTEVTKKVARPDNAVDRRKWRKLI